MKTAVANCWHPLRLCLPIGLAVVAFWTPILYAGHAESEPLPPVTVNGPDESIDLQKLHRGWPLDADHATGDWFGVRHRLAEAGVQFDASLIMDWGANLHGGSNTEGSAFRKLFDASLTLSTELLFGWKGGTFYADFQTANGEDGSEDMGDIQAFSNIDEADFTALYELWYEQLFFDGMLRLKLGKVDANGEFAYVDNGAEFINSSPVFSPTMLNLQTYPDPATSVNLFIYPFEFLYLGFGLYDGSIQEGIPVGRRGPSTFFKSPADHFFIGELGFNWSVHQNLDGRLGLGSWAHDGPFERFDGPRESSTAGYYVVFDQTLWRENPDDSDDSQGIGLFLQYGYAHSDVSEITHHASAGVVWTGALPRRDNDATGIMASPVWLTGAHGPDGPVLGDDMELAVEWFYKIVLTPWLALKPDLQYILNPGGVSSHDNALVTTLRIEWCSDALRLGMGFPCLPKGASSQLHLLDIDDILRFFNMHNRADVARHSLST